MDSVLPNPGQRAAVLHKPDDKVQKWSLILGSNFVFRSLQIQDPALSTSAISRQFGSVLLWGRNQVEKIANAEEGNVMRISKQVGCFVKSPKTAPV